MGTKAQRLRALLDSGEHFIAADCYSALTGRIVERVGFKAAYLGGHACSAFHYAVPDNGIYSQVEQIEQAGRIADVMDIPLIADADTLGETVADAFHFVRRYERAGVAGIHVEDELLPKHSTTYKNDLMAVAEMQAKIEACVKAREDPAFVIIARCDELYHQGLGGGGKGDIDEAIRRGRAYMEAGADALVYPLASPEHSARLLAEVKAPMCAGLCPSFPGATLTLNTGWGWTGAAKLHWEKARELFANGRTSSSEVEDKARLIQQDLYDDLIADWARRTGRS